MENGIYFESVDLYFEAQAYVDGLQWVGGETLGCGGVEHAADEDGLWRRAMVGGDYVYAFCAWRFQVRGKPLWVSVIVG